MAPPGSATSEVLWTGFYAGVNAGGGVDHFAFPYSLLVPAGNIEGHNGITADGPFGGLQAGYNYELPFYPIVAGIEIDAGGSGISGETTAYSALSSGRPVAAIFGSRFLDFGTARVRLGYSYGRFLPYLTAGLSFATTETFYNLASPGFFASQSSTVTRSGIFPHVGAAGIGLEYAATDQLSLKVEYLYDFINARSVIFNPSPASTVQFNTRTMYHLARIGLNYHFDWLPSFSESVAPRH